MSESPPSPPPSSGRWTERRLNLAPPLISVPRPTKIWSSQLQTIQLPPPAALPRLPQPAMTQPSPEFTQENFKPQHLYLSFNRQPPPPAVLWHPHWFLHPPPAVLEWIPYWFVPPVPPVGRFQTYMRPEFPPELPHFPPDMRPEFPSEFPPDLLPRLNQSWMSRWRRATPMMTWTSPSTRRSPDRP